MPDTSPRTPPPPEPIEAAPPPTDDEDPCPGIDPEDLPQNKYLAGLLRNLLKRK